MFGFLRSTPKATERIYLDHAAATPTRPEVVEAMVPYLTEEYGNPSAIHAEGRAAKAAIDASRRTVAAVLGVRPANITFTSGGTEANALAILGYLAEVQAKGTDWKDMEVLTTAIEHPSILETMNVLRARGVRVTVVPVTEEGSITPEALMTALTVNTTLVTFAYANSEIGTVQPVHALARVVRAYERKHGLPRIPLHVDAAQAPLWLSCVMTKLDADLLSLDGTKCGGPKGVGVLAVRSSFSVRSIFYGGGQEAGLRPGTENVPGIVGMGVALELAAAGREKRVEQVTRIRDAGIQYIETMLPKAQLNGPQGEVRIANNINISLPGIDTEYATVVLDTAGIAVSTKSACAGAGGGVSTVVEAISGDTARARSTLRITMNEDTTFAHVEAVVYELQKHIQKMAPFSAV